MEESKEVQAPAQTPVVPEAFNILNPTQFATMQRVCTMYASSDLVPDIYKASSPDDKKAIGNCMIALEIAQRTGASVLMIMQNMVPIYGKPSWSSKFLIATINACGRYQQLKYRLENLGKVGKIEYTEYEKVWETSSTGKRYQRSVPKVVTFDGSNVDNLQCIAYTYEKGSDEILESSPVSIEMAIKEGWFTKNGSKWQTMPVKMLRYRAASFWANEHAPEISMGIRTIEEQEDIRDTQDVDYEVVSTKMNNAPRKKVDIPTAANAEEPAKPVQPAQPQKPAEAPAKTEQNQSEEDAPY